MSVVESAVSAGKRIRSLARSRRARRHIEHSDGASFAPGTVKVVVYFADKKVNLYQMRQWYKPLAELATHVPVAIIGRSAVATLTLMEESPVPVVYLRHVDELEAFLREQDVRVALYVNQNARNFQMFRYGGISHVFINHGESDKAYMRSNQHKAYDYAFVAGDAARERLTDALWGYDVDARTFAIGRPQSDHLNSAPPFPADGRTSVLYSPTWEGDRGSMGYGSVASHGVTLVSEILADSRYRLVYRPHPRSGINDRAYAHANREIIAAIARANAADPSAFHVYDDSGELDWQLSATDVAITDVSAMVYDRLATGRPLIVTRPVDELADVDETGYLGACEWLYASDAGSITAVIERVRNSDEARASLDYWVEHHFGDTSPGAATRRFNDAVSALIQRSDLDYERRPEESKLVEHDPFESDDDEDAVPGEDV